MCVRVDEKCVCVWMRRELLDKKKGIISAEGPPKYLHERLSKKLG